MVVKDPINSCAVAAALIGQVQVMNRAYSTVAL